MSNQPFALAILPVDNVMSTVIEVDSAGDASVRSLPAVHLLVMSGATFCIPPSVQQEVGRQEAAEVRCRLLVTVWRPEATMNT